MKYLNKLKAIKAVYGDLGYCVNSMFIDYGTLDKIDVFTESILSKENFIESSYARFLMTQDFKIAKFVYYKLKEKSNQINIDFQSVGYRMYRKINNVLEAEIFCSSIGSGYEGATLEMLMFLGKNPNSFRNLNKLLKRACLNPNYKRMILSKDILDMSCNDLFNELSDDDILNCVIRNKMFKIDFKAINKEDIEVLFHENYRYIPSLKKCNLDIVHILKPHVKSSEIDLLSKAVGLFDDFDSTKYLLDVLIENNKKALLSLIIKGCGKGYIKDGKDIKLIANKIKHGKNFKTIIDFGYLIAGSRDVKFKDSDMSNLISLKKVVSKNFYKFLLGNETLLCKTVKDVDSDVFMKVNSCLELGQLNEYEYSELINKLSTVSGAAPFRIWDFDLGFKLSYQEFNELFDVKDGKIFESVSKFKYLKSSLRILKIKELKDLYNGIYNEGYIFESKDAFDILENKSIKEEMRNNNPLSLSNISEYLNYIILNKRYGVSSIQDYRKYILANKFIGIDNIKGKNIDDVLIQCKAIDDLISFLDLSDEFKAQYSDEIFNFLISEEFELVYGYYKNKNVGKSQLNSLALIAKSLIANKYNELKFVKEDVVKEAGTDISDNEFDNWKRTDEVIYKNYTIRDTSEFKFIMKMGEVPVRSCMHYESGGYSNCLLSNFDTTKKMLTIHKNGKYVGRAIIRLTKMSDKDYVSDVDGLSFIDVDKTRFENATANNIEGSKEENLILFLERQYTTLDREDFVDLFDTLINFLKSKAESIGAKLVVSKDYENIASKVNRHYTIEEKYVFITASKNGHQYLDSFDGSTTKAYCYKKGRVLIY